MKDKQAAIFAIIGSIIWVLILVVGIINSIAVIVKIGTSHQMYEYASRMLAQSFIRVLIVISFLIFFIAELIKKRNSFISIMAITASISWFLLTIANQVTIILQFPEYLSQHYNILSSFLILLTAISFFAFFVSQYKNGDKAESMKLPSIFALVGCALWVIPQVFIFAKAIGASLYNELSYIHLITLFCSGIIPIFFSIYFIDRLVNSTKH